MHLLMDGIYIQPRMKGVGRYTLNTLRELLILDTSLEVSILLLDEASLDALPQTNRVKYIHVRWRNHLWHGFKTLPMWVRQLRPDVVYVPYETTMGRLNRPYAMVCHDIPQKIREAQKQGNANSGMIRNRVYYWMDDLLLGRSLRGAERVFSNSHYVAEWLKKEVRVDASRLACAPCAPGADFFHLSQEVDVQAVRERLNSPDGYILTFYTGDSRENFAVVSKVYQKVVDAGVEQNLVVAGVRNDARALVESSLLSFPWRDRVRIIPFLESGKEKELAEVYAAASIYLDPSLQEGFGMQVIEAMACGAPVVCSNRGALPEVAGNAALLVDPEDPVQMASAVKKLITDEGLQMKLRAYGYERAASFSWKDTAKVIHKGLIELVDGKEMGKEFPLGENSRQ
jgi:glycosyltransferase involved in cell wall biosynthesis